MQDEEDEMECSMREKWKRPPGTSALFCELKGMTLTLGALYLSQPPGLGGEASMSREETGMSLPGVWRAATPLGARMHRVLSRRNRQLPVAPLCNAPIIPGKEQRKLLVAQYASVKFASTWKSTGRACRCLREISQKEKPVRTRVLVQSVTAEKVGTLESREAKI